MLINFDMLTEHIIRGCIVKIERLSVYVSTSSELETVILGESLFLGLQFQIGFLYRLTPF